MRVVTRGVETQLMISSNLRISALSCGVTVFNDVLFTIPLRAATIFGPFISLGIPALSGIATDHRFRLRVRM